MKKRILFLYLLLLSALSFAGSVVVNNPIGLSVPAYNTGSSSPTVVTATPPIVATTIIGGYDISCPSCGSTSNDLIIKNVVNQLIAATISVAPQTVYFINSLLAVTLNFPGSAGVTIGQPVEIHSIGSGQKFINAPAGGYFRNDNAYWVAFNPIYNPGGFAGQFIMKFRYYNGNIWTYELVLPFSGVLNGTPLLGTFLNGEPFEGDISEASGVIEIFSISDTGDLLRNGLVIETKGRFVNPISK